MGAALLVVPAIAAAWLWVAPRGRLAAVRQLLAGGAAMAAVGLAWPVLVWLTPAADRPWVSGTSDNSIWSLIFGYNGFGRLLGQAAAPAAGPAAAAVPSAASRARCACSTARSAARRGWLLGFAIAGGIAVVAASRVRRSDARTRLDHRRRGRRSRSPPLRSARRRGSSTPTTSRRSPRSPPRWSVRV